MMKRAILIATCAVLSECPATAEDAYRCKNDAGKTIIQSWPCEQTEPKAKPETKKPDYAAIVECSMKQGAINTLSSTVGKPTSRKDCTK